MKRKKNSDPGGITIHVTAKALEDQKTFDLVIGLINHLANAGQSK